MHNSFSSRQQSGWQHCAICQLKLFLSSQIKNCSNIQLGNDLMRIGFGQLLKNCSSFTTGPLTLIKIKRTLIDRSLCFRDRANRISFIFPGNVMRPVLSSPSGDRGRNCGSGWMSLVQAIHCVIAVRGFEPGPVGLCTATYTTGATLFQPRLSQGPRLGTLWFCQALILDFYRLSLSPASAILR